MSGTNSLDRKSQANAFHTAEEERKKEGELYNTSRERENGSKMQKVERGELDQIITAGSGFQTFY